MGSNKAHPELSSHYRITSDQTTIKYEIQEKDKYTFFVTMVAFEIMATKKDQPISLLINFMGENYEFILNSDNNFKR